MPTTQDHWALFEAENPCEQLHSVICGISATAGNAVTHAVDRIRWLCANEQPYPGIEEEYCTWLLAPMTPNAESGPWQFDAKDADSPPFNVTTTPKTTPPGKTSRAGPPPSSGATATATCCAPTCSPQRS